MGKLFNSHLKKNGIIGNKKKKIKLKKSINASINKSNQSNMTSLASRVFGK